MISRKISDIEPTTMIISETGISYEGELSYYS